MSSNYLKAANMKLGLLSNFWSHPKAQIERLAGIDLGICLPGPFTECLEIVKQDVLGRLFELLTLKYLPA